MSETLSARKRRCCSVGTLGEKPKVFSRSGRGKQEKREKKKKKRAPKNGAIYGKRRNVAYCCCCRCRCCGYGVFLVTKTFPKGLRVVRHIHRHRGRSTLRWWWWTPAVQKHFAEKNIGSDRVTNNKNLGPKKPHGPQQWDQLQVVHDRVKTKVGGGGKKRRLSLDIKL